MVIMSVIVLNVSSQSWADCALISSARAFSLSAAFFNGLTTKRQKTGRITRVRTTASRTAMTGAGVWGNTAVSRSMMIRCAKKMAAIITPARRKGEEKQADFTAFIGLHARSPVALLSYRIGQEVRGNAS